MAIPGSGVFDQLIAQSDQLVARNYQSQPQVQRNLQQIVQETAQLRNRTSRYDRDADSLAATTLLANTGTDTGKLERSVDYLQLRVVQSEAAPDEAGSLEEFVDQMRKRTIVRAINQASAQMVLDFDDHMDACMEADVSREKHELLDVVAPHSLCGLGGASQHLGPGGGSAALLALPSAAGGASSSPSRGSWLTAPPNGGRGWASAASGIRPALTAKLSPMQEAGLEAVQQLNDCRARGEPCDVLAKLAEVSKQASPDGACTMNTLYEALRAITDPVKDLPRPGKQEALLGAARSYLEAGYEAHMMTVIRNNPGEAVLGARPSNLARVQALLRVKLRHLPTALDVDFSGREGGGFNTAFYQVFYCLRCGYVEEAVRAAAGVQTAPLLMLGAAEIQSAVRAWAGGGLSGSLGDRVDEQARVLLSLARDRDRSGEASQRTIVPALMLLVLLAGSKPLLDALLTALPSVCETIEDFLWLKLSMTAADGAAAPGGGAGGGVFASPTLSGPQTSAGGAYTLSQLQREITHFPHTHYTNDGKEPLRYVMVLILTLQMAPAVTFLWQQGSGSPSGGDLQCDAAHLCIAMEAAGVLEGPGTESVAEVVHLYGRRFVRPHNMPEAALQYYMLAAVIHAGGDHRRELEWKGRLLRELLVDSKAFGFLNQGGGAAPVGGVLSKFVPDPEERRVLIAEIAFQCHVAAQLDEAVELYSAAGQPASALGILNQLASERIERAFERRVPPSEDQQLAERLRAGQACVEQLAGSRDPEARAASGVFHDLGLIRQLVEAHLSGSSSQAVLALEHLNFLPLEAHRVESCAVAAAALLPPVGDRLRVVLECAVEALRAEGRSKQLECLASFVAAFQGALPVQVIEAVNRTTNMMLPERVI